MSRINALKEKAESADDNRMTDAILKIGSSDLINEIRETLSAAAGDPDSAEKCEKRILELKIKLDEVENIIEWPSLIAEVDKAINYLKELVRSSSGKDGAQNKLNGIEREIKDVIAGKDVEALKKRREMLWEMTYSILNDMPAFWGNYFTSLIEKKNEMSNQGRANELINQGRKCVDDGNLNGLRNVVNQLSDLLPANIAEEIKRGYGSTVM
jgi:molecular chaperone DnaK